MKRRAFVKSALAATAVGGIAPFVRPARAQSAGGTRQYFELRTYILKSESQRQLVDSYWGRAAIPAYNRMGIRPIGVFTELDKPEALSLYVLIPFGSIEQFAAVPERLAADATHRKDGAAYLDAARSEPAYARFQSSLLLAFEEMPALEVPQDPAKKEPWIFELRTYESHSEAKGDNKVKMFNSGEIPLMRKVHLGPVFFGQAILGSNLPNLAYMVSGPDREQHKQHWKAFFDDAVWKQLIGDAQYKDNVSKVVSVFLQRTASSQI